MILFRFILYIAHAHVFIAHASALNLVQTPDADYIYLKYLVYIMCVLYISLHYSAGSEKKEPDCM